jgi:hypothetical protein
VARGPPVGCMLQNADWKPEGKRLLGRRRCRWEDNIKMYLSEIECKGVNWIHLAQDEDRWRVLVTTVMTPRLSLNAGNSLTLLHVVKQFGYFLIYSLPTS